MLRQEWLERRNKFEKIIQAIEINEIGERLLSGNSVTGFYLSIACSVVVR